MQVGSATVRYDALLFSGLVGAYFGTRFIPFLPQPIPFSPPFAAVLLAIIGLYWWIDQAMASGRGWLAKLGLILMAGALIAGLPTALSIQLRQQEGPAKFVHDGLIQSEEAVRFLQAGVNPYGANYADTPMAEWPFRAGSLTLNPALKHYPYLPLTFLLPLPFQVAGEAIWGWFDQRIVYLGFYFALLLASVRLTERTDHRLMLVSLLALSPAFVPFFVEGRNDILPLFWLVLMAGFHKAGRPRASAASLAVACACKQLAWPLVPFFLAAHTSGISFRERLVAVIPSLVSFAVVFAAGTIPFLLWNAPAFLQDTLLFQTGALPDGYPIGGLGFGGLLLASGVIESNRADFPFWALQALFGIPVLIMFLVRVWRTRDLSTALVGYAIFLLVFLYFSPSFNDNYLGFLIAVFGVAGFMVKKS